MIRETFDNAEIFESDEYATIMDGLEDDFYNFNGLLTFTRVGSAIYLENDHGFRWMQYYADEDAAAAAFRDYVADCEDD